MSLKEILALHDGSPLFEPTVSRNLLLKLGAIAVHAEEFFSPDGYYQDAVTLRGLIADREVQTWIRNMGPLLPQKRPDTKTTARQNRRLARRR